MSRSVIIGLLAISLALALSGFDRESARTAELLAIPFPTPSPMGPMPTPTLPPFFPPNEPPPLPFTSLTLEIIAPSQAVLLLQPVPLIVKLTNNGSRPALGYKALGFRTSPIYVDVRKTDASNRTPVTQLDPLQVFSNKPHAALPSGESIRSTDLLTLNLSRYFPEPGTYEIRAKLANPGRTQFIESNVVIIAVREPGPLDRPAYNLIKDSAFGEYLFSGFEFNRTETILETLATMHPQSPYARHANYLLGETYFHRRDYVRALPKLVRLENDNGFIYAEKVRRYLAEIRGGPPRP